MALTTKANDRLHATNQNQVAPRPTLMPFRGFQLTNLDSGLWCSNAILAIVFVVQEGPLPLLLSLFRTTGGWANHALDSLIEQQLSPAMTGRCVPTLTSSICEPPISSGSVFPPHKTHHIHSAKSLVTAFVSADGEISPKSQIGDKLVPQRPQSTVGAQL